MPKYSDEEIRNCKKITCKIAADYLGVSAMAVSIGMRNDLLPIGFTIRTEERYKESWSYHIIAERLIAYKYGKITQVQVESIEKNLNTIITQFEEMKKDLLFYIKRKRGVGDIKLFEYAFSLSWDEQSTDPSERSQTLLPTLK